MRGARPPSGLPRRPGEHKGGRPVIDLVGKRYGKLLVLGRTVRPADALTYEKGGAWWATECACGRLGAFSSAKLRLGKTLHCGGPWHRKAQT